jgi:hypothetical protein
MLAIGDQEEGIRGVVTIGAPAAREDVLDFERVPAETSR